jgi:hypothetical protein
MPSFPEFESKSIAQLYSETERLVALGIVQDVKPRDLKAIIVRPHPRAGRKRVYGSDSERQKAYRRRRSRTVTK